MQQKNNIALQVGVKILLKNKENKYLLLRRSLEKYPEISGRWDIAGGRIDAGTPLLENLKRELHEETGLTINGQPRLIAAQDILIHPGRHVVRLTYRGDADGEVVLDMTENDRYQWYSWNELIELEDMSIYFKELLQNMSQDDYNQN